MSQLDDIELARALHVLFVTHWIGGVAFITLVALPLARASDDAAKGWALFEAIEKRFSVQVRWSIPLAGATGLWMACRLDLWAHSPTQHSGGWAPWHRSGRCSC